MFNDLSLWYPSIEAWAIKKDCMPKKHDSKKNGHINVHEKKGEEKKYIAMPSCYPNKGERDS